MTGVTLSRIANLHRMGLREAAIIAANRRYDDCVYRMLGFQKAGAACHAHAQSIQASYFRRLIHKMGKS